MNAQNALAPIQALRAAADLRGHVTGPIPHAKKSSFLASFNRVKMTRTQSSAPPCAHRGRPQRRIPGQCSHPHARHRVQHSAPRTSSAIRHSGYVQYSYQDWTGPEPGRGRTNAGRGRLQQRVPRRRLCGPHGLDALRHHAEPGLHRRRARLQPQQQCH
jgi:hypothetical protein